MGCLCLGDTEGGIDGLKSVLCAQPVQGSCCRQSYAASQWCSQLENTLEYITHMSHKRKVSVARVARCVACTVTTHPCLFVALLGCCRH